MSTSGVTINELSRDDLINAALRKLMVLGEGQVANSTQLTTGAVALNALVSELVAMGMPTWKRSNYNLVLVTGQSTYTFGIGQAQNTAYPVKLLQARRQTAPDFGVGIDMDIMSWSDFNLLPAISTGTPVNINYQAQINKGIVTVWPTPDASVIAGSRIVLTYNQPFDVFIGGTNTPDFPQEYNQALIYQLALALSDEYGTPEGKKSWIEKQADKHLQTALSNGSEEGSLFLMPDAEGWDFPNAY